MTAHDASTPGSNGPPESGLDTSNGLEFVQQRIGLFARIIALISLAFLIVGAVAGLALQLIEPVGSPFQTAATNTAGPFIAHVAGLVLLATVWLLCRWKRSP